MTSLVIGYFIGPYIVVHAYLAWCFYRISKWNRFDMGPPGITYNRFILRSSLIAGGLLLMEIITLCLYGEKLTHQDIAFAFPGTSLKLFLVLSHLTVPRPIPEHLCAPREKS